MDVRRWERLENLFHAAAPLSPEERDRFLVAECGGDADLIEEIRALLDHGDAGRDFLEVPAIERVAKEFAEDAATARTPVDALAFPVPDWDRYEFIRILGQGGMGVVYLARDRKLNRPTALKFLRETQPDQLRRFLQEARAQASISHESVCRIFEVGEVEGRAFIAMEYIEGQPFDQAYRRLPLEARVLVIRRIADALAAAHRIGIIHRDLKPSNIMISAGPDGQPFPVLMDFGLAREIESEAQLTESGVILGTPAFMSPEQAAGKSRALDRRTDVYSLGATMYAVLCGRPPFVAENNIHVLFKVLHDDPPPPSKLAPNLPRELQIILLKCLEKDPNRRYDSAAALAEDLERYLSGNRIDATGPSLWRQAMKLAGRYRAATASIGLGLMLGVVFSGYAVWADARSRTLARLTQEFGEMADRAEADLRFSYAMPPHDTRPERARMLAELDRIRRRMAETGPLAVGPGECAIGRIRLALGDFREATAHLRRAREAGLQSPVLDYAEGRVFGEMYKTARASVEGERDPDGRSFRLEQLEEEYLKPARERLRSYRDRVGVEGGETPYIEGLLALYQRDFEGAIRQAETARRNQPWFYEAYLLESNARLEMAREKANAGDYEKSDHHRRTAGTVLKQAIDIGRSDPVLNLSEARLWLDILNDNYLIGKPTEEPFAKATAACDRAIALHPEWSEAFTVKALCHERYCSRKFARGENPLNEVQAGLAVANQAIALDGRNGEAHLARSILLSLLGDGESLNGAPFWATYDQAIAAGRESVRLSPESAAPHQHLATLFIVRGYARHDSGGDPLPDFNEAESEFGEAIRINPKNVRTLNNRGALAYNRGTFEMDKGRDPRPDLSTAILFCRRALEVNPNFAEAYLNLGGVHLLLGQFEAARGRDPMGEYEKAIRYNRMGTEKNPNNPLAFLNLAETFRAVGAWRAGQGIHPRNELEQAEAAIRKAEEIGQNAATIAQKRAENRRILEQFHRRAASASRKPQNRLPNG